MKTPQQVIEGFIQEKMLIYSEANTRLEPVYAKYFGEPLLDRADNFLLRDRQEVDGVEQSRVHENQPTKRSTEYGSAASMNLSLNTTARK